MVLIDWIFVKIPAALFSVNVRELNIDNYQQELICGQPVPFFH